MKVLAENRKARHEYAVLNTLECGIELHGTEVKSIRNGSISLKESWCEIKDGELLVNGMHISPYEQGNIFNRDPLRVKKLLAHKSEINQLIGKVKTKGVTLIPLKVYANDRGKIKVDLGICKGKTLYDKRESAKQKEINKEIKKSLG